MKTDTTPNIFSLAFRVRLEGERAEASRNAEAQGQRVIARLATERRVQEALEVVARKQRSMLERLALPDFETLAQIGRSIVSWLLREDRPAVTTAADGVALALERVAGEEPYVLAPALVQRKDGDTNGRATNGAITRHGSA